MEWYLALLIYGIGILFFIVTMLIMYKATDNYEKQKEIKKHDELGKHNKEKTKNEKI